jgi:tetratricopeptide (TPR) repeat protein
MHARVGRRRPLAGAILAPLLCAVLAPLLCAGLAPSARAQMRDTIPSRSYYIGVEQLYRGDYRDAQRTFSRALTSGIKTLGPNGQVRWIDSICYHAMLGETLYQWGQPAAALEQFNFACSLFLQYPRWMLRVQFDSLPRSTNRGRLVPWGASTRTAVIGDFPETYGVQQGSLDNQAAVQQGGIVQMAQVWPVNVVEIVRCTALAIRRRNEILGPLGPYDAISKELAATLSRGGAPPNHWSSAWVDLEAAFAHAGVGEINEALACLDRATVVGGQFDHPLTAMALLEQGRLALDAGNLDAAVQLIAEASYSAYAYQDVGAIDESFRWAALAFLASGQPGVHPSVAPAAAWARRERYNHLAARLNLALAEELMNTGDWPAATAALATGEATLQDARNGMLGNRALFLEARAEYHAGRDSAPAKLAAAIAGQAAMSLRNYQVQLANGMFDAQTLSLREAPAVYEILLADPTPADVVMRLFETLAVMSTRFDDAFDRWLTAALDRGNMGAVLDVADRAKRRRFHNASPWGGRLAAVRDLLAVPTAKLDPRRAQQRSELLDRFADFADAASAALEIRTQLDQAWKPAMDDAALRKTADLWKDYSAAVNAREVRLADAALAPVPADMSFPPLLPPAELQRKLRPGQALLVYHDTPDGLLGFLFTTKAGTYWNCGPSTRLGTLVSQMLRDLGNYDANREMTTEQLASDEWQTSSAKVGLALLEGSSLAPAEVTELIVVPDGVVWYVPFEALIANVDGKPVPFTSVTKIRYAPTVGLAFRFAGPWRRVQRTGVVLGGMIPGEKPEEQAETAAPLLDAVPGPFPLSLPGAAPSPDLATLLDALIVLDDIDANGPDPAAWSPLPIDRAAPVGMLDQWLSVAGDGPQRIVLAGLHTLAERGGRASRRRGAAPAGSELFLAGCTLMSAGAETMLLSRWRVGGQSTLDIVREFAQELPHTAAAAAWQRSVGLIREQPIDPATELRVSEGKAAQEITGKHPFFWAGYLLVDSGWHPEDAGEAGAAESEPNLMAPAGAAPAVGAPGNAAPAAAPPAAGAPAAAGEAAAGPPPAGTVPPPPAPPGTGVAPQPGTGSAPPDGTAAPPAPAAHNDDSDAADGAAESPS